MAEWSKAAVLKTVEVQASVGSNPTSSAMLTRGAANWLPFLCAATVLDRLPGAKGRGTFSTFFTLVHKFGVFHLLHIPVHELGERLAQEQTQRQRRQQPHGH